MTMDVIKDSRAAIDAAAILREQIATLAQGDPDFIRDTLEGETDLKAVLRALVASIGEDEALVASLKAYEADLATRRARIESRAQAKRALVIAGLEIAGHESLELDVGTVSLIPVRPKVIETEPADIPAEFWTAQPPKLDKTKLAAALKAGQTIPGAALSNGGQTVAIRRK